MNLTGGFEDDAASAANTFSPATTPINPLNATKNTIVELKRRASGRNPPAFETRHHAPSRS
jgi:hypothetical protein